MTPDEIRAGLLDIVALISQAADIDLLPLIEHAQAYASPGALLEGLDIPQNVAAAEWAELLESLRPFWEKAKQIDTATRVQRKDAEAELASRIWERFAAGTPQQDKPLITMRTTARVFRHSVGDEDGQEVCETRVPPYGGWVGRCTCGAVQIIRTAGVST